MVLIGIVCLAIVIMAGYAFYLHYREWFIRHGRIRLCLLGIFISSVMFGCPFNYNPLITGRILDKTTGEPIKGARIEYSFSQWVGVCSSIGFSLPDGSYFILPKLFTSILPYGDAGGFVAHPLYESVSFSDLHYMILRPPYLVRKFDLRLLRLRDKYQNGPKVKGELGDNVYNTSLADELKNGWPSRNYAVWFSGPNPRLNQIEVDKEINELAAKNSLPYTLDTQTLITALKDTRSPSTRSTAAEAFGKNKAKESLPYLEECVREDENDQVRSNCRVNYYKITGKIPVAFSAKETRIFEKYFKDRYIIDLYSKLADSDPLKKEHLALKASFEEFTMQNSSDVQKNR